MINFDAVDFSARRPEEDLIKKFLLTLSVDYQGIRGIVY